MAPLNRLLAFTLLLFSVLLVPVIAQDPKTEYTYGTDANGVTRELPVNRYPALYTGDFGDCLGGESLFNITKFDAAYYADNLTIVFHLDGTSNIRNESLMMQISVDAYGSNRFEMVFDPCLLNIYSLCPLNASIPVTGWAVIPVGPQQIGGIPPIAFDIPDFEGSTTLKIFANSSRTQIGCFQAVMRNGNTFSHPEIVAPVLAAFVLAAIVASFSAAAYGFSLPHMRMHYAHSLSVFVVWEILQSIFFSGALSVEWPSVLVAWWSNFAWSAGLINIPAISESVNSFAGVRGNASQVGGAGTVVINNGGGLIQQIYGRSLAATAVSRITKRAPYNASDPFDYTWSGEPVGLGLPTPGTWYGFWADLAATNITGAAALLIALVWLLIAIALVALSVVLFKVTLEALSRTPLIKKDRLSYFRSHWFGYLGLAVLRTIFISFFMVMVLAIFQFTNGGTNTTTAISGVAFAVWFVFVTVSIAFACRARTRLGRFEMKPDRIVFHRGRLLKVIVPAWESTLKEHELEVTTVFTIPLPRICHINHDPNIASVHQDQAYIKKFGWLSARYRRTKWWFFAYYAVYLLGRAAFLGAGVGSPLAQVYGLLIYEIIAFALIIVIRPFEGTRNNALAAWMLSISKILTTGLSVAFLPDFNTDRIIATAIGVIIIVIQGLLLIGMMILIFLSAMSSWMSLTRNQEEFYLDYLESARVKYFEKMEVKAADEYQPRASKAKAKGKSKEEDPDETLNTNREPSFSVVSVRREPKIEDEDEHDVLPDLEPALYDPQSPDATSRAIVNRAARTNSVSSRYSVASVPRRPHQSSVSSRDFAMWNPASLERPDSSLARRLEGSGPTGTGPPSVHFADENGDAVSVTKRARAQSSSMSLRSRADSRPGSPFTPGPGPGRMTPSRETLARYAEERTRYSTPTPVPDLDVGK
ncbi:TRP domain containing protein [Naviculisporaceae sp. PSN 640]